MLRKSRLFMLVGLSLLAASAAGLAQKETDQSGTKATVVLKDGSTLELYDFALFSSHIQPAGYIPSPRSATQQAFAVKVDQFWRVSQPRTLKSLERLPNQNPAVRDWAAFNVSLTSGEQFSARLPLWCERTWLSRCESFEFAGKTTVLGASAEFAIEVRDVQSISQDTTGRCQVVDTAGKTTTLTGLTYRSYHTPPDSYVEEFSFMRVLDNVVHYGQPFDVVVDRSTVSLKLEQIESLVFSDGREGGFRIRMRTGEKAEGRPSDAKNRIQRGFGRPAAGLIWFDDLSLVRSITFGPLTARTQ